MNNQKIRHFYMNAAEVMDMVIEIFKKSVFVQIGYGIITSILSSIFLFLLSIALVIFGFMSILAYGVGTDFSNFSNIEFVVILIFFLIAALLLTSIAVSFRSSGNIIISMNTFKNEKSNLDKIIFQAIKKIPAVASVMIAEVILLIPFLVLIIAAVVFYFTMFTAALNSFYTTGATAAGLIISFVLLAVFIMFLLAVFFTVTALAVPVGIYEKRYFFGAVYKSFVLVKSDFFKIMGLIIIWQFTVWGFSYGISAFATLTGSIVNLLLPAEHAYAISMTTSLARYALTSLLSVILSPLSGIFTTVMYINRKIKCEGYDITMYLENNLHENPIRRN